jgi:hypothetical protein
MKVTAYFRVALILTLCVSSISLCGQANITVRQNGPNTELYFNRAVMAPTYNEVIGSPYLYEEFVPAKVNEIEMTHFIRFNVFDNNIEFKGDDGLVYSMTKPNDYSIKLMDGSNKVYETHDYDDGKKTIGNTFFERIYMNGKFSLFFKEMIEYIPVKIAKNSFETNRPAKFINTKGEYYLLDFDTDEKVLIKLPNKEKQILKLFNDHATAVKNHIKKEGLRIDNKNDLIRILDYYFTLKSS